MAEKITTRAKDYSEWYQDVVREAGLAENSAVRGCMVIKPHGYAIWEKMQRGLDRLFKDTGHVNAYFPLFIPRRFLEKEAEHVEGFAKECAVVTHSRLIPNPHGKGLVPDPESKLEEELVIRPTSETIIWNTYKSWIQSYRDLPLLLNQWCNVVRWEMRTRLFLRTAEFLWQEGHTAHATQAEAEEEARKMLEVYRTFAEEWMAMPVLTGPKTEGQKFPGAVYTLCIEAMMQDRRALQAGTSHFLGQNFARAFDVKFQDQGGQLEYAWATSWGVSTRMGVPLAGAPERIVAMLKTMQTDLLERARKFRDAASFEVNSYDEFKHKLEEPGGFLWAHWDGTRETEDHIAAETKATIRCIPFSRAKEEGKDLVTGKPSAGRVVFAKAY